LENGKRFSVYQCLPSDSSSRGGLPHVNLAGDGGGDEGVRIFWLRWARAFGQSLDHSAVHLALRSPPLSSPKPPAAGIEVHSLD